jgi:Icc-related predicted phosphoesterase
VANKPTSPQDATGRAAELAAKANAKALQERADEISISRQAEAVSLENDVFDPKNPDQPLLIDEIEEVGVSVNNESVVIRTIADIEDMTYGVVNGTPQNYSFKQGVRYKVSKDLANYLQGIGYLWLN